MNIPNIMTCFRILLIPLFTYFFFSKLEYGFLISILIFVFAGATDVLDGYIARKYGQITKMGQVLDPLADKLMQMSVLFCFTVKEYIPIWIIIIYGIKELIMILGGIYLYLHKEKLVVPANKYGKIATILFYMAVIMLSLPHSNYYLFYVTILISLLAFIQYLVIGFEKIKVIDK